MTITFARGFVLIATMSSHKSNECLLCILATPTNSKDTDEIWHNAAFHQGLHCFFKGDLKKNAAKV